LGREVGGVACAAVEVTAEIGLAVLATTLLIVAVFVPVATASAATSFSRTIRPISPPSCAR